MNEYNLSKPAFHTFMAQSFAGMKSLKILETQTTGTLDFTAWEMLIEIESDVDEPLLNIKRGQKSYVRGVSLQWWRWEGGSLEDGGGDEEERKLSEEGLEGWKIVREHDYMVALRGGNVGVGERLFS